MRSTQDSGHIALDGWSFYDDPRKDKKLSKVFTEALTRTIFLDGVHILAGLSNQYDFLRTSVVRGGKKPPTIESVGIPIRAQVPIGPDGAEPTYAVDLAPLLAEAIEDETLDRAAVVGALRRLADALEYAASQETVS